MNLTFTQADIQAGTQQSYATVQSVQLVVISGVAHTANNDAPCMVGYNVQVSVANASLQPLWKAIYSPLMSTAAAIGQNTFMIGIEAVEDHVVYALPQQVFAMFQPAGTTLSFKVSTIDSKTQLDEPAATALACITIIELQPDR
jgi:hypothetical protein